MATDLHAIENELLAALHRRAGRRRPSTRMRVAAVLIVALGVFSAAAYASGIARDLGLDPTAWSILGGGSVQGGEASYAHARRLSDGSSSTFLVEHDAGLGRYAAFLLHEQTLDAASATSPVAVRVEPGMLCTRDELTRAESVALATLRSSFPPGADADATKPAVDSAVQAAFAGTPCRGLEYGGEQARLVYAGVQPATMLMPGAR